MPDLRAYALDAAARAGIDGSAFSRQIDQESGFNPQAHNAGSNASGIAQIVPRWHPGVDVWDPYASLDYAANLMAGYVKTYGSYRRALAAYNWGSGHVGGYTDGGVVHAPWDGRRETLPAETQHYLDVILGPEWREPGVPPMPSTLQYNPDAPVDLQPDDFSCSEQSAQWLLRSIGRNPGDAWIEGKMLDLGLMTREYGLMDASGASLAAWLQKEYGDEMGLTFTSKNGATWEDMAAIAGRQPMMIGGRSWGHWSGVRRLQPDGLELANPAPNWRDVGLLLDRAEFDRWGSWSYITVSGAAPAPPTPPADPRDARIAELEAALAAEREKSGGLITALAVIADDRGDDLQRQVDQIRAIRQQFIGARP